MRDPEVFFVGYLPDTHVPLRRFLKPRVILTLLAVVGMAVAIAASQAPLGPGTFEFGRLSEVTGVVDLHPYPSLRVARPSEAEGAPTYSRYLLTVFGKRGAEAAMAPYDGKRVRLQGALIYRDNQVMIEVDPDTVAVQGDGSAAPMAGMGVVTLTGEIVDSKCFLGVMKPGNLKTHKACAIRCISGGVPPVLLVRDTRGMAHYFLLTDDRGGAVNDRVLDMVAQPLTVTGRLYQQDGRYIVSADPETYAAVP